MSGPKEPRPPVDAGGPVRPGEALDLPAVDAWLKGRVPGLEGSPEVTQFPKGASNWTYRLAYPGNDLVLRRPPAGTKAKSAHDMAREFRVQQALKPAFPLVPDMVAFCDDPAVLGCDFYVMRRIRGIILRKDLPPGLSREATRALCLRMVDTLADLHRVDPAAAGLASLGRGAGYCRRQVDGWSDRYRKARTWNVPSFEGVMAWLSAACPPDVATCVIHNDWRFDNLVLDPDDPTRIAGVLDWEMATLGDPLMDLGSALAYWVQADDDFLGRGLRRQPTHAPGMLTRLEVVARYGRQSGLATDRWPFYEVFGNFRLAVIAQQIYVRYFRRQTRNPAYRRFWLVAHYLLWRCRRAIRQAGWP